MSRHRRKRIYIFHRCEQLLHLLRAFNCGRNKARDTTREIANVKENAPNPEMLRRGDRMQKEGLRWKSSGIPGERWSPSGSGHDQMRRAAQSWLWTIRISTFWPSISFLWCFLPCLASGAAQVTPGTHKMNFSVVLSHRKISAATASYWTRVSGGRRFVVNFPGIPWSVL